jgi:hypothetical protein
MSEAFVEMTGKLNQLDWSSLPFGSVGEPSQYLRTKESEKWTVFLEIHI